MTARTHHALYDRGESDQPPELPEALRGMHRLVLLGDSITELAVERGSQVWLLERWLAALYPAHPIQRVNAGVSGRRSPAMLVRFADGRPWAPAGPEGT